MRSRWAWHRARRHGILGAYSVRWGGTRRRRRAGWSELGNPVFCVGTFGKRNTYGRVETKTPVPPEAYTCFVTLRFSNESKEVVLSEIEAKVSLQQSPGSGEQKSTQMQIYQVSIPPGQYPGGTFQAMVGGQIMQVPIPADFGPPGQLIPQGRLMQIQAPAPAPSGNQLLQVVVPYGLNPGDAMQFQAPSGAIMEVTIPEGAEAGKPFTLEVPAQAPPDSAYDPPGYSEPGEQPKPEPGASGQQQQSQGAPRVVDNEFGADRNGIVATVPTSTTIRELLLALEKANLCQTTEGQVLDLDKLHAGKNTYESENTTLLSSVAREGDRVEVEGFLLVPTPAGDNCCVII